MGKRWGAVLSLVAMSAASLVSALPSAALAATPGPLDNPADQQAMHRFESAIPNHTFGGMITPLYYDKWPAVDANAKPNRMDAEPDSGNYTGVYLAAESYRYAMAKAKIAATNDKHEAAYWTGQRDQALQRATEIIRYYHVLVNIASTWKTRFNLKIDPSKVGDETGFIDFGGGVIKGEKGLLMRACTANDNTKPIWQRLEYNHAPTGKLLGPFAFEGKNWHCLNSTSRDSYAGTVYGLSVALDFLAKDVPALKTSVANDLMAMADYAYKYYGLQPRPHGTVANPATGGNDLEGPISPLFFPQAPIQRLHLLQTARHAAKLTNNKVKSLKYDALWAHEVAVTLATGQVHLNSVFDATQPHDAYYKYQLELMSFFNVIRLEPARANQKLLRSALSPMWATLFDDGNAFQEMLVYALTGTNSLVQRATTHHHEWLEYYAFHEQIERAGKAPWTQTAACGKTLVCVNKTSSDATVSYPKPKGTTIQVAPGQNGNLRAKDPIPVPRRRLADFLWQKDPTIITGDHDKPWQGPSIDFLIAYWMIRYYTEVERPAVSPLPTYVGPRFS